MAETKKSLDKNLEKLNRDILKKLKSANVHPDFRGEYFSNRQLNDLREVLETKDFALAKQFQSARIQPRDSKWERIKNELLLEYLEKLEKMQLDLVTAAFIIGKLNPILGQLKEKENE